MEWLDSSDDLPNKKYHWVRTFKKATCYQVMLILSSTSDPHQLLAVFFLRESVFSFLCCIVLSFGSLVFAVALSVRIIPFVYYTSHEYKRQRIQRTAIEKYLTLLKASSEHFLTPGVRLLKPPFLKVSAFE